MSNNLKYIIGALLLIVGIGIGWMIKPSSGAMSHDHEAMGPTTSQQGESTDEIWTCSMHPQIRQNEPGICPICEMDLIPLDNSMMSDDPTILQMSNSAVKLAQIETTTVGGGNYSVAKSRGVKFDGTIELDERTIRSQSSHVAGRVESMNVTYEGEYVRKGQKIATIYSTGLLAASQELITAAKYDNRVSGILEASKQKLKNWKITDSQIAQILNSQKPIETIDLFADHEGYVLDLKVSLGDYLRQGQTLYTVGSTSRLWLILNVFESYLNRVKKGQMATFTTPSLGNQEFDARITYIEPLLNPKTRTATVRAEITNRNNQLKPGMLIKGSISGNVQTSGQSTITVPSSAVLWTGENSVVYVQLEDSEVPTFQFREVTIGDQSGGRIEILEGLERGEKIVTHGAFAIDAAAQLNNNMSMMNKDVAIKKDVNADIVPDYTAETPDAFKDHLDNVTQRYIALKDALVNTDPNVAAEAAEAMMQAIESTDMTLLGGEAHMYWMDLLNALNSHTEMIKDANDVEEQRNQFDFVSQALIKALKAFGTKEETYYVQYCPMAKNNQGADWISMEEQIRNPYFGDKMMKCGSVKILL